MKYAHIITGLGLIIKAQEFHKASAVKYADLFNRSFTGEASATDLRYTPLQVLYQQLAQRHLCQFFYFEKAEHRYRELVDIAILETEPGQETGQDDPNGEKGGE